MYRESTRAIIERLLAKRFPSVQIGKTRGATALEVIIGHLWQKEITGDNRALAVRLKYQDFAASGDARAKKAAGRTLVVIEEP